MLIAVVLPALAAPICYFANQRYQRLARYRRRRQREDAECRANDASRSQRH
jgi:hypothetical protein